MPDDAVRSEETVVRDPSADRARATWCDLTASYQGAMSCGFGDPGFGDPGFEGSLTRLRTRSHQVLTWRSTPIHYRRTRRHIRTDGVDSYLLVTPAAGRVAIGFASCSTVLGKGTATLLRMDQPFEVTHSSDARFRVVTLSGREVSRHVGRAWEPAPRIDLTTGLGSIVRAVLDSTVAQQQHLTATEFDAVMERLGELTGHLVAGLDGRSRGRLAEIELAVREHVRLHADDPHLSTRAVARSLGWSTRQVQLALQQAGTTVRDLIRDERLSLARDRLVGSAGHDMSITEIAHRSGFRSASSFGTAFRERFGMSPKTMRDGS